VPVKRVSIRDVAARAGVSIATVSRIINRSDYPVSAAVRRRVLRAVETLQYSPSLAAQGLRKRFSSVIGLIVRDISTYYFGEIAKGVTQRAMELGYLAFVCNTGRDPAVELRYHELLWQHRVKGIILSGGGIDSPAYREMLEQQLKRSRESGLRVVSLASQGIPLPSIIVDYVQVSRRMCEYLIARGHRRIALVTGGHNVLTTQEHLQGYRLSLKEHRLPFDPALVFCRDFTEDGGYEGCREVVGRAPDVTAICAGSDMIAAGALRALEVRKLRVPTDISLIGIGDVPQARFTNPPLTTMRIPRYEMAVRAVDLIAQEQPSNERIVFTPDLIERDSVRYLRSSRQRRDHDPR
jgi:LacI family transcriptional regulator